MDTTPLTDQPENGESVADLTQRLRALDPADAPDLADELADRLGAALDAGGGAAPPSAEPH